MKMINTQKKRLTRKSKLLVWDFPVINHHCYFLTFASTRTRHCVFDMGLSIIIVTVY